VDLLDLLAELLVKAGGLQEVAELLISDYFLLVFALDVLYELYFVLH
jgi:predicted nucleic acid-binding protein